MQKDMETRIAFKCYIPSNTFLTWIQYKHYPIVSLEQEDPFERRLSQIKYNSTSYGKWWIPINLSTNNLKQIILNFTTCLTPDLPSFTVQQQIDGAYVWIVNIQRAAYSPDLAPCDCFLFPNLKKWFGKKRFITREQLIAETEVYFEELLLAPHFQAGGVRQLFPCWDEPHFKATFNISMKHSRHYSVLSNMPRKLITPDIYSDSLYTYFDITPPMSTFQITIVVTDYNYIRIINENITLWWIYNSEQQTRKLKFAQRIIYNTTLHLKSEFNGINIPKMDHVVIPNFPQDGTSKWGLIFHTEANLMCDEQSDSITHKIEVARLIASKIAYQWFSNVYNYTWWSQFWLHDGLATLFGEETIVKIFNDSKIMDFLIVQNQYESLHLDSHFDMNPTQITSNQSSMLEMDSLFRFPRHLKVLIILRMLQSAITDKVFRNNVHTYVNRQHYPIVSLYFEREIADSYKMRLSQKYNSTSNGNWWIPINLKNNKLQFAEEFLMINFTICLTPDSWSDTFNLQQIDWAYNWIVNIQRAGYYRVKYNLEGWHEIANYLKSTAGKYEGISIINRAKIIDDAFHLMMERQLNVSVFWNLTQFLSQETNFIVWYPMFKVFEYISNIFPYSKNEIKYIDIIKEKLRKMLDPLIIPMLQKNQTDFNRCLRQEILKWACVLPHRTCIFSAILELDLQLKKPEIYP
ncbi:PREDICTED: glutamyl aminopeptidase-like [Trachymyrmex septentrionalis]|uniref:glutamyl aminopeptidase-like n=1 Tax=Trachymyrmex septentrionalis TaxID=34720 RepID=UPI00084F3204|nr:PREDICTED: glutamyl aminopeptidase-like [Trachymyrmex septentrionalis]